MSDETVGYVLRYGGACRDCADADLICPSSGLPCDPAAARKAIRRVLEAVDYGERNGFLHPMVSPNRPPALLTALSAQGGIKDD